MYIDSDIKLLQFVLCDENRVVFYPKKFKNKNGHEKQGQEQNRKTPNPGPFEMETGIRNEMETGIRNGGKGLSNEGKRA